MANTAQTILIVDDESGLRALLRTILEEENYKVFDAENGVTAIDILNKERIDMVISDIRMPNMDGIQLGIHCKENYPGMPFALISGGSPELQAADDFNYLEEGKKQAGACTVLKKPFDLDEILSVIEDTLSQHSINKHA